MSRGLDQKFISAMHDRMMQGDRKGRTGWDAHWKDEMFNYPPKGPLGAFMVDVYRSTSKLMLALKDEDDDEILDRCADVANYAMMVADYHGCLQEEEDE